MNNSPGSRLYILKHAFIASVMLTSAGCYTTRLYEPGADPRLDQRERHEARQWFALGGVLPLSDSAGSECEDGIAWATSGTSALDVLLRVGIGVGAGLLVAGLGDFETEAERSNVATSVGSLTSFLIGSQTLEYVCRGDQPATPARARDEEDEEDDEDESGR